MYKAEMRFASDVMVDDHIKIGENALLYRISEVESTSDPVLGDFVLLRMYLAGDDTKTAVGWLCVKTTERLKVYNQK